MILHGFSPNGEFVAVDPATMAAERGFRGSAYWRKAKADPEGTAREMIESTLAFRAEYPDFPSHSPEAWDANFFALAPLISR